jgi:signal peptidase II
VAAALGLDGWLKWWSLGALGEGQFQPLIPGLVSLTLLFNPGAAWGLLSGQTELLVAVRLGVGLGLLGYLLYRPLPPVRAAALALVAAGGLGNGLDKLLDGTVVDMLYSPLLSAATQALYRQDYPVFNLADVWVVLGVAVLLLGSVGKQSSKENPARP